MCRLMIRRIISLSSDPLTTADPATTSGALAERLPHAEDAGVTGLVLSQLLGQMRIRIVLGTLEPVEALLVLGGLLAHLAFFELVLLTFTALGIFRLLLQPVGQLFLLLLWRLDH